MDNYELLIERIKNYILNQENKMIFDSRDDNEEHGGLDNDDYRICYFTGFEKSEFIMHMMTTLRPINFAITYDEDINNKTGEITNIQVCFVVGSGWIEDNDEELYHKCHYFVNKYEDFDYEKVINYYNDVLSVLKYNNLNLIEEEIKEFFNKIK